MVKKNYKAWHLEPVKFSDAWSDAEKLRLFARYATLAPSGHNTQPWKLKLVDSTLELHINRHHHLSSDGSGLLSVEPYVSLGAFLETFSMAAQGLGHSVNTKMVLVKDKIAELSIKDNEIPEDPRLIEAITHRVSNRNPFEKSHIDPKLLNEIDADDFSGVGLVRISKRKDIEYIAEETATAVESIMRKPLYRRELSRWVRTNHTRKYDGMPGFTHGFGGVQSLVSRIAVRHMPKHGLMARKSKELIRNSGALIIVTCKDNSKNSFVNAGRAYARIAILATKDGFATSAVGASVVDPETRESVKKHFSINDRPIFILRMGLPTVRARHSPRWPVEQLGLS